MSDETGPLPDWMPINYFLLANPLNWLIVILMVLIGTILACFLTGALRSAHMAH